MDSLFVFLYGGLVAIPLCSYAQDSIEGHKFILGVGSYILGVSSGIAGATFHVWKGRIGERARVWIIHEARRWWPWELVFALIYFYGWSLYDKYFSGLFDRYFHLFDKYF